MPESRQRAMLVGPAVIVGLPDTNGDSTDVPTPLAQLLTQPGRWRVEVRTIGDPKWYRNQATYDDYFETVVWAMVTLERWSAAEDARYCGINGCAPTRPHWRRLPGFENRKFSSGAVAAFSMASR